MKKTILTIAILSAASYVQADTKLYGHVSYNLGMGDNSNVEEGEDYAFHRYGFSETRIGVKFKNKLDNGLTALAFLEFGVADGEGALDSRRQAFGFSGNFGKVLFGQYNDVGDGVLHADLAGTGVVDPMGSSSAGSAGRVTDYGDETTDTDNVAINVNGFDPGRGKALRYYTPKLGGIATVGIQLEENEASEIALKLNASGFRLYAFYNDNGDNTNYDNRLGALAGYKFSNGLSFTATFSENESITGTTTEQTAFKVGYAISKKHKLSYKFQTADRAGDPEENVVAYLYNMSKGVQLWAAAKTASIDNASDSDGTSLGFGGRIKF